MHWFVRVQRLITNIPLEPQEKTIKIAIPQDM